MALPPKTYDGRTIKGKPILPAILIGIGGKNLPTDVVANEYLNFSGKEFSKSKIGCS